MSFEWFNDEYKDEKNKLEKLAKDTAEHLKQESDLKLGNYKASQVPDDRALNIDGEAKFLNKKLEKYTVYGREVESKLETKFNEIKELKEKINELSYKMSEESDYQKRKEIYQELKVENEKLETLTHAFGDPDDLVPENN